MLFREIAAFDVVHGQLDWPWIAFDARGGRLAYASSSTTIATLILSAASNALESREEERVLPGPSFPLPPDLALRPGAPTEPAQRAGLTAFAISTRGDGSPLLAVTGIVDGNYVVATLDASGERRARVDALLGDGHAVQAIAFDRSGRRLWLSTETATETVTALVDAESLETVGVVRTPSFPRPALHELHVHPVDDAVLLLAACGDDGSFARVVGFAGDVVSLVPTALDSGSIPAGFVGFSADAARVHLAEADELRTHAWPTLDELSSVPFEGDFVSSFSGAVLGNDLLVDGQDSESNEDAVMLFDRSAIRGNVLPTAAPSGMWAGRLGSDAIVTIQAKGDPARARVLSVTRTDLPAKRLLS